MVALVWPFLIMLYDQQLKVQFFLSIEGTRNMYYDITVASYFGCD